MIFFVHRVGIIIDQLPLAELQPLVSNPGSLEKCPVRFAVGSCPMLHIFDEISLVNVSIFIVKDPLTMHHTLLEVSIVQ